MAKKFVRGITNIKNIEHQDFDTNNVNDLLSDGKHNYIHRKKADGSEEYHNLTDNIKTIESDDTDLLTVTNYNNTTNSATIRPKHDAQKEQVLESTDETILITHGENGTDETTTVDVNFDKVQGKLTAGAGINLSDNTISFLHVNEATVNCNNIITTQFLKPANNSTNLPPSTVPYGILTVVRLGDVVEQTYQNYSGAGRYFRTCYQVDTTPHWSDWKKIVTQPDIDTLLAQKQNTLTSNASIGVDGTGLIQLYSYQMSYSSTSQGSFEGSLDTYAKAVKKATHLTDDPKLEYHFTAKLNEGHTSTTIPLNNNDKTYFSYILIKYGQASGSTQTAMINGLIFSLTGSDLTITGDNTTYNQVVSFSDIIDPSQNVE